MGVLFKTSKRSRSLAKHITPNFLLCSEGFTVLTVHKSTLKRKKKEAEGELKINDCEDEKRIDVR